MQREWPLYFCQQLLPGPFSTICTNQWKWIHPPKATLPIKPCAVPTPPTRSPQLHLQVREQSPLLLLRTQMLWQVNVVSKEYVPRWQHSLQGDYYPWFIILIYCGGLRISCLQLISSSRSLSALCSSFYLSPSPAFFSLCPASANPTSRMLYPRNLMEVIWLPINRADRGKTPGQCTTVPIMLNTSRMERKPAGLWTVW